MKNFTSRAREMFDVILAGLPAQYTENSELVHTDEVLVRMAQTWPQGLDDRQERDLEMLCRKVHVVKEVMGTYASGWKKVKGSVKLPLSDWAVLITVLLGYSDLDNPHQGDRGGFTFKYLNAALLALELVEKQGTMPYFHELQTWAGEILENRFNLIKI